MDAATYRDIQTLEKQWWDPLGPHQRLHALNAVRLEAIRGAIFTRWERDGERNLEGIRILDVGSGAGFAAEYFARRGARVTGIDMNERMMAVATDHAHQQNLPVEYRRVPADELVARGETFDVVLALDMVEQAANFPGFMGVLARLVHGGGQLFVSTINRTPLSWAMAQLCPGVILPRAMYNGRDWKRFRKPDEIHAVLTRQGMTIERLQGLTYNPLNWQGWQLTNFLAVNYLLRASRPIP